MYDDNVEVSVNSAISGKHTDIESLEAMRNDTIPLLAAFARDDEIQYMQIVSTNIGMIRTYQKRYKKENEVSDERILYCH